MSQKIYRDAFFTQFLAFLSEMEKVFPEDPDFPAYNRGIQMMKSINPKVVITEFQNNVFKYEATIRERNADFFLKHEFSELSPDNTMENIINKLKGMWTTLSPSSQGAIWDYVILLLDLCKRCTV